MMVNCPLPDGSDGVALRMADFLQCQAQALGENGYRALAGSALVAGLMTGLLTIVVALIGYRFVLGGMPTTREAVGWTLRIGMVIALATGWPAFQILVYRVAVDGPPEIATILMPAAGLPTDGLTQRVQRAYDAIRLGSASTPVPAGQVPPDPTRPMASSTSVGSSIPGPTGSAGQPQVASTFVVATLGVLAALRLGAGFLLAIGPLAIMTLLFDATTGLFAGWMRALGGTALGLLAATVVTALHLLFVEEELARFKTIDPDAVPRDPQALATVVIAFSLVMLVALWAAARTAGGFRLARGPESVTPIDHPRRAPATRDIMPEGSGMPRALAMPSPSIGVPERAQTIANALAHAARRDRRATVAIAGTGSPPRDAPESVNLEHNGGTMTPTTARTPVDRRSIGRKTRSAMQRDGSA